MRKDWGVLGILAGLFLAAPLASEIRAPLPPKTPPETDVGRFRESWRVLEPSTRGNLSIYPVVSDLFINTSEFITLDEGVASGEVKVMERGQVEPAMYRRRTTRRWPEQTAPLPASGGASVNELVLVNNSSRPLILLAGEVVSGGKQNRVIGADVVVPPKSEPLPLAVFCVEHGRWSAGGGGFGSAKAMAHPEVRRQAQVYKSQQGVWDSVARAAEAAGAGSATQDYAHVLQSAPVKREWEKTAASIESDYERELREHLRGRGAVGVVVAIDGELVWSDIFSSPDLFRKYWPKLLRSYVIEAHGRSGRAPWNKLKNLPSAKDAHAFLLSDRGQVTVKTEPGAYRRTEISANDYQVVALEALRELEEVGLLLHYNKMART